MATTLKARLLGRPAFAGPGGLAIACASRKAVALVAYLLYTRQSHTRTRLAGLFWGTGSPRHAAGSLRVALTKIPRDLLAALAVERDTIGMAPGTVIGLDIEDFNTGIASADPKAQADALRLYSGALLEGAEDDAAPEFSDWLVAERNRIRQVAHDAHVRIAQSLHAQGRRIEAREAADAWLRHDPSSEAMHKLLMGWLAQGEGPDQALGQYEVYRRARAVAHGAAPSEDMAALADRLRRGNEPAPREAPARITAATSFFGRNEELAELRGLLADPACRLLTIHGFGGVGKTRLAMAIAELEAAAFPGGVHVVALDGLRNPRFFAQTVARACGLQPAGNAVPLDLVASFLADRVVLLVLDNLEHLLGGEEPVFIPQQVAALLRATGSRVKVIATSREPLRLQEEWLYELGGLAYPASPTEPEAQGFAAVQFFAQRARQAYVGFSLAAELPNVVQLCQTLEGLPLGLELAASWVRAVPCAEIAGALRDRASELRNRHLNRAARHDSLGAVVAYSWDRLPMEQREALSGLAALVGTFSREAAEHVAQASLRTLSALTEKSLLHRAGGGRWHLHEVVRQYAWDQPGATPKARATRQAAILKRRDGFFLDLLHGIRARLEGAEEPDAIAEIELESPNIRAAWHSVAAGSQVTAFDAAAPAWFDFLECRTFNAEGLQAASEWLDAARRAHNALSTARALTRLGVFQRFSAQNAKAIEALDEAIAKLEALDSSPDLANALVARAFTRFLMGRLEDAEKDAARALDIAERVGDAALLTNACRVKGLVLVQSGRRAEGRDLERRALEAAAVLARPSALASAHNNLALAENHLGNYEAAETGYENALMIWRDVHNTVNIGRAMHNLGAVSTRRGDYGRALERYRAALEFLRKAGDRNLIALNLMSQGDALVRMGKPDEARSPVGQALLMAERDGNMLPALDARIVLAQAALATGDPAEVVHHLAAVFEGAKEHHFTNVLADAVIASARLLLGRSPSQKARAYQWVHAVAQLVEVSVTVRRDAQQLETELAPQLSTEMREAGKPRDLKALAKEASDSLREAGKLAVAAR